MERRGVRRGARRKDRTTKEGNERGGGQATVYAVADLITRTMAEETHT